MKEKLYTIPLNDAMDARDECPFCYIERKVEQDLLDFMLGSGSSYMEADMRAKTDKAGFCRTHFKKMFDYGNTLGNGWILKTHSLHMIEQLKEQVERSKRAKQGSKGLFKKESKCENPLVWWAKEKVESCYICKEYKDTYERYLDTFFVMYKKEPEFREKVAQSKGMCIPHFGDLCAKADQMLFEKERADFYTVVGELMIQNLERVEEDIAWLVEKFDYRNQTADWKQSKDALQRGMQKLKGSYPADPIYKMSK